MDVTQVKDNATQQMMAYQKVAQQAAIASSTQENKTLTAQAVQAAEKTSDQVQLKYSATSKNLDTVRAIEQMHARLTQLVTGVRQTNEGLNQASERIEKMQSQIQTIVKNFPPFPLDSSDRQEILMSYQSLRQQMEKLMIPPPPTPVYEKVKHMWEGLFDEKGKISESALPELDSNSNDQQVAEASVMISKAGDQISNLSTSITSALVQS